MIWRDWGRFGLFLIASSVGDLLWCLVIGGTPDHIGCLVLASMGTIISAVREIPTPKLGKMEGAG